MPAPRAAAREEPIVQIKVGYEIAYDTPQPTPMLLMLGIHPSRMGDMLGPDTIHTDPFVPVYAYQDRYGNLCARLVAPAGRITISASTVVHDHGLPDPVHPEAIQHPVQDLPDDTLVYLLGSRYCETDLLSEIAWKLFHNGPRSAASSTSASASTTCAPARPARPGKPSTNSRACAATMRIWRSRCAAA